jgi:hypothetical protein
VEHLLLCTLGAACMVGAHLTGSARSWAPHAVGAAVMLAGVGLPGHAVLGQAGIVLLLGIAAILVAPGRWRQVDGALDVTAMAALLAAHHLAASHPAVQVVGHAHGLGLPPGIVGLTVLALALWCAARLLGRRAAAAPGDGVALGTGRQTVVALGGIVMLGAMLPVAA